MERLDEYDIKLMNAIFDLGDYEAPDIYSRRHNYLKSLWVRNHKDKIKVETLMAVSVKPYKDMRNEDYSTNFFFDITPEQAQDIIKELQKALDNRKKNKKVKS